MGFNNKSVLKEMEAIARRLVYDKIKDIIVIDDEDDFFIDESVVEDILKMDALGIPLDIKIGKGVYIGKGVKLNYNLMLMKNVFLEGDVRLGKNVVLNESVQITCYYDQKVEIGDNTEIYRGDVIKGNTVVGSDCRIESGVRLTGSDQFPCTVGKNVIIKGLTYVFGTYIDSNIIIEHSVIIKKKITKPGDSKSDMYAVRFYLPEAEGREGIKPL
jgi:bifunctional UDP-N-acetylglucosamine pyrophosphorylase/glucosamine-1-phosphate N-acetyltransferase